jgi:hypothetical protein
VGRLIKATYAFHRYNRVGTVKVEKAGVVRVKDFNATHVTSMATCVHEEISFPFYSQCMTSDVHFLMCRGPLATSNGRKVLTSLNPRFWNRHGAVLYCFRDTPNLTRYAAELVSISNVRIPDEVVGLILSYVCCNIDEGIYRRVCNATTHNWPVVQRQVTV